MFPKFFLYGYSVAKVLHTTGAPYEAAAATNGVVTAATSSSAADNNDRL